MTVVLPRSLPEAHAALAADPDADLLAGGTDLMVDVNYGRRRPTSVVGLRAVPELRRYRRDGGTVRLGAGLTYLDLMAEPLAGWLPGLAAAARSVGSPQIRAAGTIGGNLGTASPAGDLLPVLDALDAVVIVSSTGGARRVPYRELVVGVKRTSLAPGELIEAVEVPVLDGGQEYLKVGVRNAMVISAAGVAVVVDRAGRTVRCALGAVGPTTIRATEAEAVAAGGLDWGPDGPSAPDPTVFERFAAAAAEAARPIDDHRSTAVYRRHAVGVMARRALLRVVS